MARNRRQVQKNEEGGAPAWMNTYGDMVTLVLTMFVLLYSFSTLDAMKWKQFVGSFAGRGEIPIEQIDPTKLSLESDVTEKDGFAQEEPDKDLEQKEQADAKFNELYLLLKEHIVEKDLQMQLHIEKSEDIITLHIKDSALFNSGQDAIRHDAEVILDNTADMLINFSQYIKMIRIEGHTDTVPIHTAKFKNNWALSAMRAVNVLGYLTETTEMPLEKFSVVGYGELRPIDTNDTEEGKAHNRRVDFVIESINKG